MINLIKKLLGYKEKESPKVRVKIRDGKMIGWHIPAEHNNPMTNQLLTSYKIKLNGLPHMQGLGGIYW